MKETRFRYRASRNEIRIEAFFRIIAIEGGVVLKWLNENHMQPLHLVSRDQYIGIRDNKRTAEYPYGQEIYAGDTVRGQEFTDRPFSSNKKRKRFTGIVKHRIGEGDFGDATHKQYSSEWYVEWEDRGKFQYSLWGDFYDCEVIKEGE